MSEATLETILAKLNELQLQQNAIVARLDELSPKRPLAEPQSPLSPVPIATSTEQLLPKATPSSTDVAASNQRQKTLYPSRVILSTYPDQYGIRPYPIKWLEKSPTERGPVICSRMPSTIKLRNALGAHSGSYSIYRALSIAMGSLDPSHKPDYSLTTPPFPLGPDPQNLGDFDPSKIVSFDPWGHLVPSLFKHQLDQEGLDIRPSIAITKAHIKLSEIDDSVRKGTITVDGKIVLQTPEEHGGGVELDVSKAAVEPVWWLPGVAERFGISESLLRRALFEDTGGMYPELITRPDIQVFLPPIGNFTVYIFGPPAYLSDPSKYLTLRVHDECNGSDVFGSDICTCKPYLVYAIEECARTAQKGGVGLVVYFRKEGRALGEVTKYLVYNLRKREGDRADKYFKSTEMVAGVKDMRFQALMPDVLHWLGVKKVDAMVSMSDMKYDAIVGSGIPIHKRYDIPEHLIPPDSRVEISAKIAAGYFSSQGTITEDQLVGVKGRGWDGLGHIGPTTPAVPDVPGSEEHTAALTNAWEETDH